ncbi:MAG: dihydropteroate synthase [Chloroflexi bacterium]|nr:dihydropteroate synthase [Chloroflexota bacterium]
MYHLRILGNHTPAQLRTEIEKVNPAATELRDHIAKAVSRAVKLERVPSRVARFIFQELVLEGGDVVLPPRLDEASPAPVDVLLFGTDYQLQHLAVRIRTQGDSELNILADHLERALTPFRALSRAFASFRDTRFDWGARTYVMGIVNVTPDSFSGDGVIPRLSLGTRTADEYVALAVAHAEQLLADGADILDIGGESTRPGSQPTPAEEELRRVIPVIRALRQKVAAPISIDTYKADVARAALDAGADIVNDVWGLRMDAEMKRVVAERGAPVVIMHNRSQPKDAAQSERLGGRYIGVEYTDLMSDIIRELREQIELGLDAGIAPDKIIIDPGIGFGKTVEQNLELLNRADELRVLGYPVLIGPSRKGFIGFTLDLPVNERVEGTAAAVAVSVMRGADIVRVHDVKQMARVAKMTDAIVRTR